MNRRTAMTLAALAASPGITGFGWPQVFDLSWDEEVQLHDGRVIVVHLKFTYERLNRFSRYDQAIRRNTEMSFDAGQPDGRVTQVFQRQRPSMLDSKDGRWYVVLDELAGLSLIRDEDWGPGQNSTGQRVGVLSVGRFRPVPLHELPAEFDAPNLLLPYGTVADVAQFDGTKVTLKVKERWLHAHPLGPSHRTIDRPNPSVFEQMQRMGENK